LVFRLSQREGNQVQTLQLYLYVHRGVRGSVDVLIKHLEELAHMFVDQGCVLELGCLEVGSSISWSRSVNTERFVRIPWQHNARTTCFPSVRKEGEVISHLPCQLPLRFPSITVCIKDTRAQELVKDGIKLGAFLVVGLMLGQDVLDTRGLGDNNEVLIESLEVDGIAQLSCYLSQEFKLVHSG